MRRGNSHSQIVPYGSYPAADGWMVIACGNDAQFARLSQALGRPEWPDEPRFLTNTKRVRNRLDLEAEIGSITSRKPRSYWLGELRRADVPVGPVNNLAEALNDDQTVARGLVQSFAHPEAGEYRAVGCPIRIA